MKLIIYTLNEDGTVPEYVIDGGHLAWSNNKPSPQDLDLVGLVTDEASQTGFASEEDLLAYAESKDFVFKNPRTKEIIPLENVILDIWQKQV